MTCHAKKFHISTNFHSGVVVDFEFIFYQLYSKKNVSCCLIFAACQLGLNAFLSGYRHISQLSHNGPSIIIESWKIKKVP